MSVYRRKGSPNWWVNISVAGRKFRRSASTDNQALALEFEARERERLWRVHKLLDPSFIRWEEAAARWLSELPERSRAKEGSIIGWFSSLLRDEPLCAIDKGAIDQLRQLAIDEGRTKSTVNRNMAVLRAVLRKSVERGYLDEAPVVPMFTLRAADMRWLTRDQFEALAAQLPQHLELAARCAVLTGLRMRSMLRLTWDRVDLAAGRLWIPGEQMKAGTALGLPISRALAELLHTLRVLNPNGPHVFQWNGRPIDDCNTKAFQEAVERAGVAPLRWHDLRHTFAAWAVQSGVTVPELMALGAWKSHSMALRYSHLSPDHLAAAAEKISSHSLKGDPR